MKKLFLLLYVCFATFYTMSAQATKVRVVPNPESSLSNRTFSSLNSFEVEAPAALFEFSSPRIVGGTTAGRSEYPEFAQLYVDGVEIGGEPGLVYPVCGATLISSKKVLTAAHCTVDFATSNIYVLPAFYSFNDAISFNDLISVSTKAVHSSYSSSNTGSDVSVLTLSSSANSALAKVYAGTRSLTGHISTVIGVGRLSENGATPATLQKVTVPVVSNGVCASSYASSGVNINSTMLCAGLANGGKDSCQGDSGGPLWATVNNQKTQIGIVSFGIGCARPNFYGVYARSSSLIGFIRQHAPAVRTVFDNQAPVISPTLYLLLN